MSEEILKEKEQNIEKLRKDLNSNKIPKLGIEIEKLYNKLNEINEVFNEIRNIPKELELKRFEINQTLDNWKFKIVKEEKENNNFKISLSFISLGIFGNVLPAFAGPIGWGILGLSVFCTGFFHFSDKNEKETLENIFIKILSNSEKKLQLEIVEISKWIEFIYNEIEVLEKYENEILCYHKNYKNLTEIQKDRILSCSNTITESIELIIESIKALMQNFDYNDYINNKGNDVKKKNLFVLLTNMLENVYLNEEERKILVEYILNNEEFFKNNNVRKEDMTLELLNDVFDTLSKK